MVYFASRKIYAYVGRIFSCGVRAEWRSRGEVAGSAVHEKELTVEGQRTDPAGVSIKESKTENNNSI